MADRRRQRASQDSEDDSDSAASDSGDSAASAARSRSGSASPRPSHRPPRGAAGALSAGPRGRGADSAAGGGAAKSAPQSECESEDGIEGDAVLSDYESAEDSERLCLSPGCSSCALCVPQSCAALQPSV